MPITAKAQAFVPAVTFSFPLVGLSTYCCVRLGEGRPGTVRDVLQLEKQQHRPAYVALGSRLFFGESGRDVVLAHLDERKAGLRRRHDVLADAMGIALRVNFLTRRGLGLAGLHTAQHQRRMHHRRNQEATWPQHAVDF